MSHPKIILLVDDDQDILLVLRELLEEEGYAVQAINNGAEIEPLLQQGLPDLILLDMLMAGTDGREIAKRLKGEAIPLLMISAHPNAEQEARAAGADGLVAKPFEIDMLLARVARALGEKP
jgi:CheY-like chemotaxis protein